MADIVSLIARVVDEARGDEDLEAFAESRCEEEATFSPQDGLVVSAGLQEGLAVRAFLRGTTGFAATTSFDARDIEEVVQRARWTARNAQHRGADPPTPDTARSVESRAPAPDAGAMGIAEVIDGLRDVLRAAPPHLTLQQIRCTKTTISKWIKSTTGIDAASQRRTVRLSMAVAMCHGGQRGAGESHVVVKSTDELDLEHVADEAIAGARRAATSEIPKPGTPTAVLHPAACATLLRFVGDTFGARLTGPAPGLQLGDRLGSSAVTLVDDPRLGTAPEADLVDDEGLATRRNVLLAAGVVAGALHSSATAAAWGVVSTGSAVRQQVVQLPKPGIRALLIEPGEHAAAEMLTAVRTGIFIQRVLGVTAGADRASGELAIAAEGARIEAGELSAGFTNLLIVSTLRRFLGGVIAVGDTLTWFPGSTAGVWLTTQGFRVQPA